MKFNNRVLIIGYGAVGRCALPLLLKHVDIPYKNITVLDFADKKKELLPWIKKGVTYAQERINPLNLAKILSEYVSAGGLVIDLSWNIECLEVLSWCHTNSVLYVNTSIEEWDPYVAIHDKSLYEKSLYYKQMQMRKVISKWSGKAVTAVLDHGANPGLISHFTKQGLADIAQTALRDKQTPKPLARILKPLLDKKDFPRLAMELEVKVIHCSERDTQITDKPKRVNEFVGTWSVEGLREEGTAPVEIGWGTHEKVLPRNAHVPHDGPRNQIILSQMGMNTWVRSWVPSGEIVGMAVRHSEAFSISHYLTVREDGRTAYRPTVNYAYMPCDETFASLHELRARNYELQPKERIMNDEIIDGQDMLGALIMGHRYTSWWTGSALSIGESRKLVAHQNATTVQVAIGVISAVVWMVKNPARGVCMPEDLPYEQILAVAKPFLGEFISEQSDWTPLKNYQAFFKEDPALCLDQKDIWCFRNFLFKK